MTCIATRRRVMVISTPESKAATGSKAVVGRLFFGKKILTRLAPLPRLVRDLAVLSVRLTLAVLVASMRLVVPCGKKSLLGETVLVTGAGRGIGRELAIQLAALGCVVVCWDSDHGANRATMSAISKQGGEAHGFVVDVSKRFEVRETVRLMRKARIPEVTILVNNAAILLHQPLLQHDEDDIRRMFEVNVFSQFWTVQAFLPSMIHNKRGHIVSMCSMCGFYGVANKVPYCASKYAVRGLMDGLIEELRLSVRDVPDIKFTSVYPFYVDTGLAQDPHYRFPYMFAAVTPEYAAAEVIRAIQMNHEECSIPRCLIYLDAINRVLPKKAMRLIIDFLAQVEDKSSEAVAAPTGSQGTVKAACK